MKTLHQLTHSEDTMIRNAFQAAAWLAVTLLILAGFAGAAGPIQPPTARPSLEVPGQYIAALRFGTCEAAFGPDTSIMPDMGDGLTRCVVHGVNALELREYSTDSAVVYIEPDIIMGLSPEPPTARPDAPQMGILPGEGAGSADPKAAAAAAPCTSAQWHHARISDAVAWDKGATGHGVTVAVVDTGVGPHPDLNIVGGRDFTNSGTYNDGHGHGTHVAGIAAGHINAGRCMAGVAPDAGVLAVRVLGSTGSGSMSAITSGIVWAADQPGVRVINMSLGGRQGSQTLQAALAHARQNGVLPVCAAGNDGTQDRGYPASYPECLSVSATDQQDQRTSWSTYGSWVNIAAPGLAILSLAPGGGVATMSGTSMASPVVAGAAAALFSLPGASVDTVSAALIQTADRVGSWAPGIRVNVGAAAARFGTVPTPVPTVSLPDPGATPAPGGDVLRCVRVNATKNTAEIIPCPNPSGGLIVLPLALPNTGHATGGPR